MSRPGIDPVTLDVYDVYIVNDHGVELKAKAPPLIGHVMFGFKIVTEGISGHASYILSLSSCKYASLIKMNPTSYDRGN